MSQSFVALFSGAPAGAAAAQAIASTDDISTRLRASAKNIRANIETLFLSDKETKEPEKSLFRDFLGTQDWLLIAAEYYTFKEISPTIIATLDGVALLCCMIGDFLAVWNPAQSCEKSAHIQDKFLIRFCRCLIQDSFSDRLPKERGCAPATYLSEILPQKREHTESSTPQVIDFDELCRYWSFCFSLLLPKLKDQRLSVIEAITAPIKTRLLTYLTAGRLHHSSRLGAWANHYSEYLIDATELYSLFERMNDSPAFGAQRAEIERILNSVNYFSINTVGASELRKFKDMVENLKRLVPALPLGGTGSGAAASAQA